MHLFLCLVFFLYAISNAQETDKISQQANVECLHNILVKPDAGENNKCKDFIGCCETLCGKRYLKADCTFVILAKQKFNYTTSCKCAPMSGLEGNCVRDATASSRDPKDQCRQFGTCCQNGCANLHIASAVTCAISNNEINLPRTHCTCGAGSMVAWSTLIIVGAMILRLL